MCDPKTVFTLETQTTKARICLAWSVLDTKEKETLSRNRAAKAQAKRMNQVVENTIAFTQAPKAAQRRIDLVPRTRNQEQLVLALQNPDAHIVVTAGPAGTGKTYLAMLAAIKALKEGVCDRIVMTRPAVGVEGEQHGFLPGNLVAKMEPWTRPLLDVMREYYRPQDIVALIEDQVVEIAPLAYMRGRTFKNSWIIADEMQNATPAQTKMLMTRIGTNSKIVVRRLGGDYRVNFPPIFDDRVRALMIHVVPVFH